MELGVKDGRLAEYDFMGFAYPVAASTAAEIMRRWYAAPELLEACRLLFMFVNAATEAKGMAIIEASGMSQLAYCQMMKEARAAIAGLKEA